MLFGFDLDSKTINVPAISATATSCLPIICNLKPDECKASVVKKTTGSFSR